MFLGKGMVPLSPGIHVQDEPSGCCWSQLGSRPGTGRLEAASGPCPCWKSHLIFGSVLSSLCFLHSPPKLPCHRSLCFLPLSSQVLPDKMGPNPIQTHQLWLGSYFQAPSSAPHLCFLLPSSTPSLLPLEVLERPLAPLVVHSAFWASGKSTVSLCVQWWHRGDSVCVPLTPCSVPPGACSTQGLGFLGMARSISLPEEVTSGHLGTCC